MKLVISDLDQTLVDFLPVHDKATEEVFQESFRVKARLTEVDFAGRSLIENFVELARLKGIPADEVTANAQRLLQRYEKSFADNFPSDTSGHVLPGARRLLERLSEIGHLLVLYTGDSPGIAKKVLAGTGLEKYFAFSVYGTEVEARADMVKLAIERVERLMGRRFAGKDIVIIGDSLRDVDCGRQFRALTVAVATGFHSEKELSEAGADYVFRDLRDSEKVLQAIG